MGKILVHLHLYYPEQIDYMLRKLKNITSSYDLFVSICNENKKLERKILNFKNDAHIIISENTGYDLYPFIEVLNKVNLEDYDYIIKIHSKNSRRITILNGVKYRHFDWRNSLINALIGSKHIFKNNLKQLKNPKIAMICCENLILDIYEEAPNNKTKTNEILEKLNMERKGSFVAGTMFMVKAELMDIIKKLAFTAQDFKKNTSNSTGDTGSLAHALETILGAVIHNQGYEIYASKTFKEDIIDYIQYRLFSILNYEDKKVVQIFGLRFTL